MSLVDGERQPINPAIIIASSEAELAVIRRVFDREYTVAVHQGLEQITPAQIVKRRTLVERLSGAFRLGR